MILLDFQLTSRNFVYGQFTATDVWLKAANDIDTDNDGHHLTLTHLAILMHPPTMETAVAEAAGQDQQDSRCDASRVPGYVFFFVIFYYINM